ncbi:MAG: hypothetical protein IPF92_04660 [Myxococcales bacterium]|jgi:hypothetical protein|nr:hypothetical protein [Myxococcales bacterium]MBL0197863.1 hypothetical protein [Myxococcales bacterium]HQY62015.1 hypothetical protein [Polyangiaceae bacterium]
MTSRVLAPLAITATLVLVGCPKKNKPPPVERVWLGETLACARLVSGALRCQGDGSTGALGPTSTGAPHGPVTLPFEGAVLSIELAPGSLCVVLEGRAPACQGAGVKVAPAPPGGCRLEHGRAVTCAGARWPEPVTFDRAGPIAELAEGRKHACARMENGTVLCWGENDRGQLASPPPRGSRAPAPVQGIYGATALVAAADGTCAVLADKSVRCWGDNKNERLAVGHGPVLDVPTPVHF